MRLILVLFMLTINGVCLGAKINAIIDKNNTYNHEYVLSGAKEFFNRAHMHGATVFPDKHYDIQELSLYNLSWADNADKKEKPAFTKFYKISTRSSLDLVSYDPKSGKYKFKLTIIPSAIIDTRMSTVTGSKVTPIKGKLIFNAHNTEAIYLEGKYTKDAGLLNEHSNGSKKFSLTLENDKTLILEQLENIQVTVETNDQLERVGADANN